MAGVRGGPARVVTSGDLVRADGYVPRAMHLLRQTEERARVGGLSVLGNQWALDGDSYCYAVVAGGISTVHIVAGHADVATDNPVVPVSVPDFVSGAVRQGFIKTAEGSNTRALNTFHPTQDCARAFDKLRFAYQPVERLAVTPAPGLEALEGDGRPVYSQYTRLKPTMYSGMMRKVVQALMGFGRQRREDRQEISLYDGYATTDTPRKPSDYAQLVAENGLQIRYDWRFPRTHGITTGSDGALWLVEISVTQGVIAMPLPLHPETTTPGFRRWVRERQLKPEDQHQHANDDEALRMLDVFGGFPTGESFPSGGMDAWIRAGRVIRLLARDELDPFYQDHAAYSSAMGWAFNASGSAAHNTAWRRHEDGYQRGVHDAVFIDIGSTAQRKRHDGREELKERIADMRAEHLTTVDAAVWKVDYLSAPQVRELRRALAISDETGFEYLDALELEPAGSGNATYQRRGEGKLWHNHLPTGCLIKFHEPLIDMLLSHDMRPQPRTAPMVRCNTVVHVFFAGEELKYVRFWADPRTVEPRHKDNYETCMNIGAWYEYDDTGTHYPPSFYSDDIDERVENTGHTTTVDRRGTDQGWCGSMGHECIFGGAAPFYWARRRRFKQASTMVQRAPRTVDYGVAVPHGEREGYVFGFYESAATIRTTKWTSYSIQYEPWWTVVGRGCGFHPDCDVPACPEFGAPPAKSALPKHNACATDVRRGVQFYVDAPCADDTDKGAWHSATCEDMKPVPSIPEPPNEHEVVIEEDSNHYRVTLVSSLLSGPMQTAFMEDVGFLDWRKVSPFNGDPMVSSNQRFNMTGNALGRSDLVSYMRDINWMDPKLHGSPRWPGLGSGGLTLIGVVDG